MNSAEKSLCFVQATIGIDFLSKTMYHEDRTVCYQTLYFFLFIFHNKFRLRVLDTDLPLVIFDTVCWVSERQWHSDGGGDGAVAPSGTC